MGKGKDKHRFLAGYSLVCVTSRFEAIRGLRGRLFLKPMTEIQARTEAKKLPGGGGMIFELVEVPDGKG